MSQDTSPPTDADTPQTGSSAGSADKPASVSPRLHHQLGTHGYFNMGSTGEQLLSSSRFTRFLGGTKTHHDFDSTAFGLGKFGRAGFVSAPDPVPADHDDDVILHSVPDHVLAAGNLHGGAIAGDMLWDADPTTDESDQSAASKKRKQERPHKSSQLWPKESNVSGSNFVDRAVQAEPLDMTLMQSSLIYGQIGMPDNPVFEDKTRRLHDDDEPWDAGGTPLVQMVRDIRDVFVRWGEVLRHLWRSSAQFRVVVKMTSVSVAVILVMGIMLVSWITQRTVTSKVAAANAAVEQARRIAVEQIDSWDTSASDTLRINAARNALTDRVVASSDGTTRSTGSVFEPVFVAPQVTTGKDRLYPESARIPDTLREMVRGGAVAYQFAVMTSENGQQYRSLVIGTPVGAEIPDLELYLILPLTDEESTLALIRGLTATTGMVLVVFLVGIGWAFSQQITAPVRAASRIAERFASGHLRERMTFEGEDEMARLATSFNAMADSISKQIQQLEEYGSLQKQFTSDVSHELRTPLTSVRMAADIIHDDREDLSPAAARAADVLVKELDRFETLLGDLLEISRHDAGVADLNLETVDIRACIASAWGGVHGLAEELGIPVRFRVPSGPVMVPIDIRRIERVLRNLLGNALDHAEKRPVDLAVSVNKKTVSVIVLDHGVGLKPGQEELVFNRFWRADSSRVRRTGGTGLGLSIALKDVVLHGGFLEAGGEPGVGAVFRMTLPLDHDVKIRRADAALPLIVGERADHFLEENSSLDLAVMNVGRGEYALDGYEIQADGLFDTQDAQRREVMARLGLTEEDLTVPDDFVDPDFDDIEPEEDGDAQPPENAAGGGAF